MTYKENITAILECHFGGFKQEIIDNACNCILEIEPCEYAPFTIAELKDEDMQKLLRGFKNQQVIVTDNDCSPSVTIIEPCEDATLKDIFCMGCEYKEQEPKTGHWSRKTKVDAYDIAGVKTWGIKCQCDKCDFTTIVVEDFGYYKYCPNCGARMAESEDK